MAKSAIPADIKKLSFEEALRALESIVTQMEQGDVPLDESLKLYQRGEALKQHCATKLANAKLAIEKVTRDGADSEPVVLPADDAADTPEQPS